MSATYEGGKKTAVTNKLKYGNDFYKKIGAMGGKAHRGGGFSGRPDLARAAGKLGGRPKHREV